MKQIFEILQEERDRILNQHQSSTKNQYLNTIIGEQDQKPQTQPADNYVTKKFNTFCDQFDKCGWVGINKGTVFTPSKKRFGYLVAKPKNIWKLSSGVGGKMEPKDSQYLIYNCAKGKFTIGDQGGYYDVALGKALNGLCQKSIAKPQEKTNEPTPQPKNANQKQQVKSPTQTSVTVKPTDLALDAIISQMSKSSTPVTPASTSTQSDTSPKSDITTV